MDYKKKISYCKLDTKGMGYNFDACPYPDTLCSNCVNNIVNGKIIE